MYSIFKLKNSDFNILEFSDSHIENDEAIIYNETNSISNRKYNFEGKCIKGKNFLLQHIILNIHEEETLDYIFEGDLVTLSFIIRGNVKGIKEYVEVQLSDGQVYLSQIVNCKSIGKLFFYNNSTYEIIHLQFNKNYFTHLLQELNWINEINLLIDILSNHKIGLYNNTMPYFNLKILNLLQDIIDLNIISSHKSEYLKLKFKELLFLLFTQKNNTSSFDYNEMSNVKSFIEQYYFENLNLERIANQFNISQSALKKKFKTEMGTTVHQYILNVKMSKAVRLLKEDIYVNELSSQLGFHSVSHFIKVFKKYYGYTPKEYLLYFQRKSSN